MGHQDVSIEQCDGGRDERVLTVAAVFSILLTTALVPMPATVREVWLLAPVIPASLAGLVAWQQGHRTIFAPVAALPVATLISGLLGFLRGVTWLFNPGVLLYTIGRWVPWPAWKTWDRARLVLWALAIVPIAAFLVAQVAGWSNPVGDLIAGRRIYTMPRATNLNAMALLWAVLAAGVLRKQAEPRAFVVQSTALLLLGATGSRSVAFLALGAFLATVTADRRLGLRALLRRHWNWGLMALSILPRITGRILDPEGTGVALSGREVVWSTYLEEGRQFLITGGGVGRPQQIASTREELQGLSTHNEYLWIAISVGVVGVLLVVAAWALALNKLTTRVLPAHPELVMPALLLPIMALVEDPLLAVSFTQPYLVLLAASASANPALQVIAGVEPDHDDASRCPPHDGANRSNAVRGPLVRPRRAGMPQHLPSPQLPDGPSQVLRPRFGRGYRAAD